jgi:hypothetical protein
MSQVITNPIRRDLNAIERNAFLIDCRNMLSESEASLIRLEKTIFVTNLFYYIAYNLRPFMVGPPLSAVPERFFNACLDKIYELRREIDVINIPQAIVNELQASMNFAEANILDLYNVRGISSSLPAQ